MGNRVWFDRIMVAFGVWVALSPLILRFPGGLAGAVAINAYMVGAAVAILAATAIGAPAAWREWVILVLGIWLLLVPWALGAGAMGFAGWVHAMSGLLIALNAGLAIVQKHMAPAPH
jgi:hypothetical protein